MTQQLVWDKDKRSGFRFEFQFNCSSNVGGLLLAKISLPAQNLQTACTNIVSDSPFEKVFQRETICDDAASPSPCLLQFSTDKRGRHYRHGQGQGQEVPRKTPTKQHATAKNTFGGQFPTFSTKTSTSFF